MSVQNHVASRGKTILFMTPRVDNIQRKPMEIKYIIVCVRWKWEHGQLYSFFYYSKLDRIYEKHCLLVLVLAVVLFPLDYISSLKFKIYFGLSKLLASSINKET